jgi:predicted GH43/DUF377 family glycosyl hydrolase
MLAKYVITNGGSLHPLIIPASETNGTGLMNPSVYVDNGKVIMNLRHCQYTIYHAEKGIFEHQYGPLVYLNPENDITLTTKNFFCELDEKMNIVKSTKVDTSKLDVKPIWEFIGLEDARVVRWSGKLYLCGVRRDTTTNGVGRMELSEIEVSADSVKEISRVRIDAPAPNTSYCEKNWMPILDKPYHFIKWTNPTEVVKADPVTGACETVVLQELNAGYSGNIRGGSQVIPWEDGYLCLNHITYLFKSELQRKNARYRHVFTKLDKDFKIQKVSKEFSFMEGEIEFACGMAQLNDDLLITFGFQDNASFLLKTPKKIVENLLNG